MSRSIRYLTKSIFVFVAGLGASMFLQGQTAPPLGTTATYGAFTSVGGVNSTGLTQITGDIGTNAGNFTGFPPGVYSGAKHVADPASLVAKNDLTIAWNQLGAIPCDAVLSSTMGNGQVLTSKTYCAGGASTLTGNFTLDAQGNPNAIFIIKVDGELTVAATSHVILANLARAANVYWRINGAVSILDNSIFKGTIISNGAIHLYDGTALEGRALSIVGAITMASNTMAVPLSAPSSLTIQRPAAGDTLVGGTQNYQIQYTGVNVTLRKTLEYSLNGGVTWDSIGTIRNAGSTASWNVPMVHSTQARVRITDSNGVAGVSGNFTIVMSGGITVVRPAAGDTLIGGTQNYQIQFTGTNITPLKTFAYSLDSGTTWIPIGVANNSATSYSWNVPTTPSNRALIRITDSNGLVGTSGMFTIATGTPPVGSITVVRPAAGDTLIGGTQNYQIEFIAVNIAVPKKFEYSIDGGATWQTIGMDRSNSSFYSWNVPQTPTTQALVRITDSNGITGISGMFTIKTGSGSGGSINSLTLAGVVNNAIGNNMPMNISWTFTPDIGTSVDVEYSLDNANTWTLIGTVPTNEAPSIMWTTPPSGTYASSFIRVTSTLGMRRMSEAFRIGSIAAVIDRSSAGGYSITNFPNPVNGSTTIRFLLPARGFVTVAVADGLGRNVGTVISGSFEAGSHGIPFDTSLLPSGIYSYTMEVGAIRVAGMMTIVR